MSRGGFDGRGGLVDDAIRALREALSQTNGGSLRPAAEADLERANEAGFPDELLDLYRAAEPLGTVDVRSYVKDFGALSARFRKIGITPLRRPFSLRACYVTQLSAPV
jgi:hypothetical protein